MWENLGPSCFNICYISMYMALLTPWRQQVFQQQLKTLPSLVACVYIEEEYAHASAHLVRTGGDEIDAKGRFALTYELCWNLLESAASHQAW